MLWSNKKKNLKRKKKGNLFPLINHVKNNNMIFMKLIDHELYVVHNILVCISL